MKTEKAIPMGFNTQPPEGGWEVSLYLHLPNAGFNTQPPEGGWLFV